MSLEGDLYKRSGSKCELCGNTNDLAAYQVPPKTSESMEENLLACATCRSQIESPEAPDASHWRCLSDAMWSEVPGIKVVSWRMLNRLASEDWAFDLINMLYLDEESQAWAEEAAEGRLGDVAIVHKDCNGQVLQAGDTVVLIKDLDVKGANFSAKRGTAVRKISLVQDNAEQIEGRVNDQHIVILTKFVKKS